MQQKERKTLKQNRFPTLLREIPSPPKELYVIGDLPNEDKIWLAVVGTRKFSNYGKEVCEKIIEGLKGHNFVIVSGLALGIDSIAHRAAIENNLPTVAVPGSGLDEKVLHPHFLTDILVMARNRRPRIFEASQECHFQVFSFRILFDI